MQSTEFGHGKQWLAFSPLHCFSSISPSLPRPHETLSYILMFEYGLGGERALWATLLIFHMLHQCRRSDSVGWVFSQTGTEELSSTFHWGTARWLCQDKKHCDQPLNFPREHCVSETRTPGMFPCAADHRWVSLNYFHKLNSGQTFKQSLQE